jgi:hypothetical protein
MNEIIAALQAEIDQLKEELSMLEILEVMQKRALLKALSGGIEGGTVSVDIEDLNLQGAPKATTFFINDTDEAEPFLDLRDDT